MGKNYKVIQYKVAIHHEAIVDKNEPWNNTPFKANELLKEWSGR